MTPAEIQILFEGCMALVISCYLIGLGIGLVLKILRSAVE